MTEPTATAPDLRIDIVSDVVCPWCIIGYKRLEKALAQLDTDIKVEIHWHPFELNPTMAPEGQNLRDHLAQKYGTTPDQSVKARQMLTDVGASLGFSFDYFDEMRMVNTFRAHQLLHWAREQGKEQALKLELFADFFSNRQNVDEADVLVAAAERVGLEADAAREAVTSGRYQKPVRDEQAYWTGLGISAVPAFIYNGKYLLSGGQEPEAHLQVIAKLQAAGAA